MNITLTAQEIIDHQKLELGNLYHQLVLEKMTNKKLADALEAYEKQNDQAMVPDIQVSQPIRRLSAAVESLPATEDQQSTTSSP